MASHVNTYSSSSNRETRVLMASPWWEQFSLLPNNGTASKDNSCFSATEESTVLRGVNFGGVPVVLLLDFIVFIVLLSLFSIIRRKFWDYGRLALVAESNRFNETSHRRYGRVSSVVSNADEAEEIVREQGFCSWLPFVIRMDEETIKDRCGSDAVHYLSFQRHLIALLSIICVSSVAIILPVNLSGNLLGHDPYSFGRTTIGNLQTDNHLLWLHTVFAVLYLILAVAVLRHHTSKIKDIHSDTDRKTLLVCFIPKDATEERLKTHFT
ncbi:hypothetical protein JZ751_009409 [Albula glossodonta]|uniref:CSC1/OSCA1-like N-terminal transmembrane domain-containing protein n=1 Tax=Albula glossodonta TaxID=121402 RepID=A0A8T2N377_9TELE|nr:hypothetical protein JZ751_009409 [Albula glossodonta]